VAKAIAMVVEQAGTRESHRCRRVGDYLLKEFIFDAPNGVDQNWLGEHVQSKEARRVRIGESSCLRTSRCWKRLPAKTRPTPFFGTVKNPVRMMMLEHDRVGEILAALCTATADYTPPESACFSDRELYRRFGDFEFRRSRRTTWSWRRSSAPTSAGMRTYVLCILKSGPKDAEIQGKARSEILDHLREHHPARGRREARHGAYFPLRELRKRSPKRKAVDGTDPDELLEVSDQ
jgi:hypothetical protein